MCTLTMLTLHNYSITIDTQNMCNLTEAMLQTTGNVNTSTNSIQVPIVYKYGDK